MEAAKYIAIKPGMITEKVVGRAEDPEALAKDVVALAKLSPGVTFTIRGPEGELVFTYTHEKE